MTPGQFRAIVLLLFILGIEILTNPAVKAVLGRYNIFRQTSAGNFSTSTVPSTAGG